MKISYNWLKSYIPEIPEAEKLPDVFTYHLCEVESFEKTKDGDTIFFDLNILPNRAHDLLSHQGIARELSGLLGIKFKDPTPMYKVPSSKETTLKIESTTENCRRYTGRIVKNIKIEPSPAWVVNFLESVGQKSINNIVDATNIIMYDCGQPCHAFDLRKISQEKIIIKQAKEGEELILLGSEKIKAKLKNSDMVIANGDGASLAIAGVKGGLDSGVAGDTKDIVLEVANFNPISVRKTARRLGILTDSAKRFENDLTPEHCDFAMLELSALILEMCPDAKFEDVINFYPDPEKDLRRIYFKTDQINNLLGTKISDSEIGSILLKYGFKYSLNGDSFEVEIPAIRLDLVCVNDITEEIGRVIGYEKLAPIIPKINFSPKINEKYKKISDARKKLLNAGYNEVFTYAFCKKGDIEISHGSKGSEFLRTNISDGLKKSFEMNRLNTPLLSLDEVKIFEIGNVFLGKDFYEETHIAYVNKKGVTETTLEKFFDTEIGKISVADSSEKNTPNLKQVFMPWSEYPFIARDVSVWVPVGTDPQILVQIFKDHGTDLLAVSPWLFDEFTKENKTSFAFRLVFQAKNRTLTDQEAYTIVDNVYNTLKIKGFEVR